MAKQEKTFEATRTIEFQYDPDSTEFIEALASFNELIADGDADDMLKYIAGQLRDYADDKDMIEGVGLVGIIGQQQPATSKWPFSGVWVKDDYYYTVIDGQ